MLTFKIDANNFKWINGSEDDPKDLCLHGDAVSIIGEEIFKYSCTVSSTALYLLKTLTEDHIMGKDNQMLPCCGNTIIANKELSDVSICGCNNGIDWTVIHEGNTVKLITESGKETVVSMKDYEQEVFRFADRVEAFYKSCSPKILPDDDFDRNGYIAFWNEWHQRRGRLK